MKRLACIAVLVCCIVGVSSQTSISFAELFRSGDMTPYIGQTLQLTDTLHVNGWGSQPRYMWVSDHRIQNECEQGNLPREVYTFSITDNSISNHLRLGTKLANATLKVTTAQYATLVNSATYANHTRPTLHQPIGDYHLKVCGFNVEKFFIGIDGYETKTIKVIEALKNIDADIFGLCEVGEYPSAMSSIASKLNKAIGADIYAAIADNISDSSATYSRAGFIYKKDKVVPYGGFTEASTDRIYKKRNIIQGFVERNTGEKFVFSMNHFKAKDTTADQSEGTRITNASHLIETLKTAVPGKYADTDILVMGDLNSCTGEIPVKMLYDEGYNCIMNRFEPNGYSIVYSQTVERLDHALASSSMMAQITGATTYHINTDERKDNTEHNMYRSSDHDPVIIGLRLGNHTIEPPVEGEPVNIVTDFKNGLAPFTPQSVDGYQTWFSDANYGARISGYANGNNSNTDWLVSPVLNLSNHALAKLEFDHAINYDRDGKKESCQTLWISDNYNDDAETATWEQLIIPNYPNGMSWTYASSGPIDIPQRYLKDKIRIAFKYGSTTTESNATWQITDFSLVGTYAPTDISAIETSNQYTVYALNKTIYVVNLCDNAPAQVEVYNSNGKLLASQQITDRFEFATNDTGVYLVKMGNEVYKVVVA